MKKHLLICAAIFTTSLVACKKDNDSTTSVFPEKTFWKGTYSKFASPVDEPMALLIQPNGQLRYYEMSMDPDTTNLAPASKVSGTWVKEGAVIKISYFANANTYNATLDLNAANTQLSGTWSENLSPKGLMGLFRQ